MARRGENIYKRKDGRYEGRYIKGYNSNGKAIYGYVYAYAYAEVRQKLALCKATVDPNKASAVAMAVLLAQYKARNKTDNNASI